MIFTVVLSSIGHLLCKISTKGLDMTPQKFEIIANKLTKVLCVINWWILTESVLAAKRNAPVGDFFI